MAYVPVPKDLTQVKSRFLFGLTRRQVLFFGLGALTGVPFFLLIRHSVNTSWATMLMMLLMLPFFLLALYEKNGQPLEAVLGQIIQARYLRPRRRPYQTDNFYAALDRSAGIHKEVNRIVQTARKTK